MTDIQKIIRLYKRRRDNKYLSDCYEKNYAIIGFGNHTIHTLFPVIQFLQVNVKYVCCSSTKKAELIGKKFKGIIGTTSIKDILNDETVAGVFVSATPASHFEIASEVIKSGKSLFIEKPPCMCLKELNSLIDKQRLFGFNTTVVGMQKRHSPLVSRLRKEIKGRELNSYSLRYQTGLYPEGNEIYDLFIHPIDLVVFLFGGAKILAMHKVKSTKKGGVTYLLMLEHDNIIGTLELSTLYSWKDASENVRVNTQDGTYEIDQMERLSFVPSVCTIGGVPIEKVLPTKLSNECLLSRNNFNPILANNQIYTQGYFNEIKTFVEMTEMKNGTAEEYTDFMTLRSTYAILEELNNIR